MVHIFFKAQHLPRLVENLKTGSCKLYCGLFHSNMALQLHTIPYNPTAQNLSSGNFATLGRQRLIPPSHKEITKPNLNSSEICSARHNISMLKASIHNLQLWSGNHIGPWITSFRPE